MGYPVPMARDTAGPHRTVRRNRAQQERHAADDERKRLTDTPDLRGGEKWSQARGHSGTRRAWLTSVLVLAGVALAAAGLASGLHVMLWIGIGVVLVTAAYSVAANVWTDYERREKR